MKNLLVRLLLTFLFLAPVSPLAQGGARVVAACGTLPLAYSAGSNQPPTVDVNGVACSSSFTSQYPGSSSPITGNAAGSTGAVVGTLAGASGKTTYICGFSVDAVGGTAAVGPITVAGLVTSSMVFQLTSSATGVSRSVPFTPCVPASATNTAITITTTADGTASAVNVNAWGYQQ
jgi:hypothetical protein